MLCYAPIKSVRVKERFKLKRPKAGEVEAIQSKTEFIEFIGIYVSYSIIRTLFGVSESRSLGVSGLRNGLVRTRIVIYSFIMIPVCSLQIRRFVF